MMTDAQIAARAVDVSLTAVEQIVVRNALGADYARTAGATDAEVYAVLQAAHDLHEALNKLSVSVRS